MAYLTIVPLNGINFNEINRQANYAFLPFIDENQDNLCL